MLGRTDSRGRLLFLLVVFAFGTIALIARLGYWQIVDRQRLAAEAIAQTTVTIDTPSKRGDIYDRTGTVVLATTVQRERLIAAPDQLTPETRRETVATLDGHPRARRGRVARPPRQAEHQVEVRRPASRHRTPHGRSDPERHVGPHGLRPVARIRTRARLSADRRGTASSLAAHLLGFVNREGGGQYGVEQSYQAALGGEPRIVVAERDASGLAILDEATVSQPGTPGTDLTLTIDAGLQLRVEQELLAAWVADKAKRVSAVVMDPYTGEVYASATYPSYDGNDYKSIAAKDPSRFIDPIVSAVYEPGSVFKMMTAAAALTQGTVTPSTRIKDVGTLRLDKGRTKIDNANREGMGWMTFEDAIAYSRNVVAAKVALGLGDTTKESSAILYDMWMRLGYGQPTGIDVAGEVGGLVRDPGITDWRQIDLANGAFGQGVAVTPIQLATAYAALVNGGTLVQPHVVKSIGDRRRRTAPRAEAVVDVGVSHTLIHMMKHVITEVPFYRDRTLVRATTSAARRARRRSGTRRHTAAAERWKRNLFNYSFVGWIGRETSRPDLVVAIQIEEGTPTIVRVGHIEMPVMSFELFRRVATDAITTPDLLAERAGHPQPAEGPVTWGCGTLVPVTDADPSPATVPSARVPSVHLVGPHGRRPRPPDRRSPARPVRAHRPRRRRRFAARRAGPALRRPAGRADRRPRLPGRGDRPGSGRASSSPDRSPTALRSATSPSSASPTRWQPSGRSRPAGDGGSIRSSSA